MRDYKFQELSGEISKSIDSAVLRNDPSVMLAARCAIRNAKKYEYVSRMTGVPVIWLMAVHEREAGGRFDTYLGNGEPLCRVTKLEPKGRGPFSTWESGALDALHLRGWDNIKDWTWERACYEAERWNGFGYREYHGVPSPYVWGSTSIQKPGKYVSDGRWDSSVMDKQPGCFALMKAIVELEPSYNIQRMADLERAQKTQENPMSNISTLPVQSAGVTTNPLASLITNAITALSFGLSVAGFSVGGNMLMAAAPLIVTVGGLVLSHLSVSGPNQNTVALINGVNTVLSSLAAGNTAAGNKA